MTQNRELGVMLGAGQDHGRPATTSSTPACRSRRACTTTCWAARTTTRPTGPSGPPWWPTPRRCPSWCRPSASCWRAWSLPGARGGRPAVPRRRHRHPSGTTCTRWPRRLAPESRVLYVDNDPIVLAHARALMKSTPEGRTAFIQADLRGPRRSSTTPALADVLDTAKPVALLLIGIVHHLRDEDRPSTRRAPGELAADRRLPRRGLPLRPTSTRR